jgi:hypothetical protein
MLNKQFQPIKKCVAKPSNAVTNLYQIPLHIEMIGFKTVDMQG